MAISHQHGKLFGFAGDHEIATDCGAQCANEGGNDREPVHDDFSDLGITQLTVKSSDPLSGVGSLTFRKPSLPTLTLACQTISAPRRAWTREFPWARSFQENCGDPNPGAE